MVWHSHITRTQVDDFPTTTNFFLTNILSMSVVFRTVEDPELKSICTTFTSSISAEFDSNTLVCDLVETDLFTEEGTSQIFTFKKNVLILPANVPEGIELRILEENVSLPLKEFEPIKVPAGAHCFLSWEKVPLRKRIKIISSSQPDDNDEESTWPGVFIKFGVENSRSC